MKVLMDLTCSSAPYGELHSNESLRGTILIKDNLFEGLVYEDDASYLTFGKIDNRKVKMIISSNYDKELPKVYNAENISGKIYLGDKAIANRFSEINCEECQVIFYEPSRCHDDYDNEISRIEKIVDYRKQKLGEESKILYENIMNNNKDVNNTKSL